MAKPRILVIRGDGVGPEVVNAALHVLEGLGVDMEIVEAQAGWDYYQKTGKPYQDDLLDLAKSVDAIFKGPIETPKATGYRSVNVMLRKSLELYANLRPFRAYPRVALNPKIDIIIVRENTEGLYSQVEWETGDAAFAVKVSTRRAAERVIDFAFRLALSWGRRRVSLVHKANILKLADGLYLRVFQEVAKKYEGRVEYDDVIVDAAGYYIVRTPERLDVIVTMNLYGDILSDVAAGVAGTMGLFGSANIGDRHAMFEPVHGTARDIAGKGVANPTAALHAASLMLRWLADRGFGEKYRMLGEALEKALYRVVEEGKVLTPDLGGNAKTMEYAEEVLKTAKAIVEQGG
ncbi:Isocitrate dehydrogenase (NAD(+)) [Pyrolobus fumarii 1A]|uniref:Isocitrate dehydrogenase (NAD(+)) n=1 Tax=Pyrolobus fumarii (strain DSM 11204 / 1A) TaxID=694429 RepID=G0EF30_PYRF1|nr:isocitrate/isopropylmalate dehydrogenase family protein [Pyrolobus fumarii]AEM38927.1 Isocitrate dehydrogenase (NAD(+)) [Pyrolobus fumarii 1A]